MGLIFNYNAGSQTYTIGAGSTPPAYLEIPDTFGDNELPVVGIEANAFKGNTTLTSVKIGSNITSIGASAFADCTNLVSVDASLSSVIFMGGQSFVNCTNLVTASFPAFETIPPPVVWEGQNFKSCPKLTTVNISNGITVINYETFAGCTLLNNVTIPETVTSIIARAFAGCNALSSITIPNAVQTIGNNAFEYCMNLLSVNFLPGSTLTTVGSNAFLHCEKLVSVNFYSLTNLGSFAFWYCGKLETVTLPNNLETIREWSFEYCYQLKNFTFPSALKSIGQKAFASTGIIAASIPNGVTSIGESAFEYCSGLITANIPTSITSLGSRVFSSCRNLTSNMVFPAAITVIPDNIMNGCLKASFTLPSTLTRVGNYSFQEMTAITTVSLPNSVTTLGHSAFAFCSELTTINLNNIISTGNATFRYCYKLNNITLSSGLTQINYENFNNCTSLTSITIPSSCTSIESNAFYYCSKLENVTFASPSNLLAIKSYAFYYCSKLENIILPNSITDLGDYAFAISGIITINIPTLINQINSGVFYYCQGLKTITIPSNIISIKSSAFSNSKLENITIPNTVKYLGDYSFASCTALNTFIILSDDIIFGLNVFQSSPINSLTYKNFEYKFTVGASSIKKYNGTNENVDIPYSIFNSKITNIENSAFENNTTLKTVNILCEISTIKSNAFKNCINLLNINMPNGTTSIQDNAFYGCSNLSEIILPKKLISIGNYAFYNCSKISSVILHKYVTSIGNYAFSNCSMLSLIYFRGHAPIFGINSFLNINQNKMFYYSYGKNGWGENPDIDPLSLIAYSSAVATGTNFTANRNVFTLTRRNESSINPFKNKNYLFLSATNNSLSSIFNPASFNSEDRISIANEGFLNQPFASFKVSSSNWVDTNSNQNSNTYSIPQNSVLSFSTFIPSVSIGGGAVIQKYPGGLFNLSSYYPEDIDALNYILAVENADQERLDNSVKIAISNFIIGCKTDETWGSIKNSCLLAGPRTLEGAFVPLIGIAPTNYNFTSYDYDRKLGLLGDGVSKCLKTNSLMTEYQKDNLHAAVYFGETTNSSAHSFIATSSSNLMIYLVCNPINLFFRLCGIGNPYVPNKSKYGLLGMSRGNNQEIKNRYNKTSAILSTPSRDIFQSDIYIFSRGYNTSTSTPVGPVSNARIAFYSLGLDIDLVKLDSRLKSYLDELATLDIE